LPGISLGDYLSNGKKELYDYNSSGQLLSKTTMQFNQTTSTYDTVDTISYSYLTTLVNAGLLSSITDTPAAGPVKMASYTYGTTKPEPGRGTAFGDGGQQDLLLYL